MPKPVRPQPKPKDTSWEKVAGWYDHLIEGEGTYQKELILPNLLRLMQISPTDIILDLACGQGFFSREFYKKSRHIVGADASRSLIDIAQKNSPTDIAFHVAQADKLPFLKAASVDKTVIVLALQNIEDVNGILREAARVTKKGAMLYVVLNHPAFRVPKESSWGWDDKEKVQYRRIDRYLSEAKVAIQMHPGDKPSQFTTSFHRPLQFYFKGLAKAGFAVAGMEEWNSHKMSEPGPRATAEDLARKEIPLFLCLVCVKH
jgi:ubiquinone/menaquinone biosynthesis C-methylase UbiE